MPRIRTIKPEFWTDKKIIRLSRDARLFFIGLWNFADDNGVLEADPLQLKALIFPVDPDIGIEEIEKFLAELEKFELIKTYEVNGTSYIWIKNFRKHQKIDRPRKSNLPLPPDFNPDQMISDENQKISDENRGSSDENREISDEISVIQMSSDEINSFEMNSDEKVTFQMISDEISRNQLKSSEIIPGKGKEKEKERIKEKDQGKEKEEKICSANALHVGFANASPTCSEVQNSPPLKARDFQNSSAFKEDLPLEPQNRENQDKPQNAASRIEKAGSVNKAEPQNKDDPLNKAGPLKKIPPCPYSEVLALYREILPELPEVKVLNETRKAYLRTRWREVLSNSELLSIFVPEYEQMLMTSDKQKGLEWFRRYFEYVRESDFLCGRIEPTGNRSTPFQADFEWLIRPTNFVKVLEGKYHKRASPLSRLNARARKTAMAAINLIKKWEEEEKQNGMVN